MSTEERLGDWILTFTGIEFWPLDPRPEEIIIEDISVPLSRLPRYTGHTKYPYSVGQHSIYIADLLYAFYNNKKLALRGLLHDGSEAYTNDISSPLKRLAAFDDFRVIEKHLQKVIYRRFNLLDNDEHDKLVKKADQEVFHTEVLTLIKHNDKMKSRLKGIIQAPIKINYMSHNVVEELFLERFKFYGGKE